MKSAVKDAGRSPMERFGRIDVLVTTPRVCTCKETEMHEIDADLGDTVLAVNLRGPFDGEARRPGMTSSRALRQAHQYRLRHRVIAASPGDALRHDQGRHHGVPPGASRANWGTRHRVTPWQPGFTLKRHR